MSVFVVTNHHIDLLVSAGVEHGVSFKSDPDGAAGTATACNAVALGRMLWGENVRSVTYRYRLDGTDEGRIYRQAGVSTSSGSTPDCARPPSIVLQAATITRRANVRTTGTAPPLILCTR